LRGKEFVDLLPNIVNRGYSNIPYHMILNSLLPTDTELWALEDDRRYHISLNLHLEGGGALADAFPAQETAYHYEMKLPPIVNGSPAFQLQQLGSQLKIGFYCSSYAHRKDVLFWTVPEWVLFFACVRKIYPKAQFVALGAGYDDRTHDVFRALSKQGFYATAFFDQHIGETVNVLKELDYFFAFPSGLGILADVVDTPCMMWFWGNLPGWEHMSGLFGKYADPQNVQSFRHITAPYSSVKESFDRFVKHGMQHIRKA